VSKNGTFILDVPGRPDGTIDSKEIAVLDGITAWMRINSEAIYETRPWKVYGEGPNSINAGSFHGGSISKLGEKDIRFTRNKSGTVIYTLVLGWPTNRSPCSLWHFQLQQDRGELRSSNSSDPIRR
jgi:alpha-L-fucosidase